MTATKYTPQNMTNSAKDAIQQPQTIGSNQNQVINQPQGFNQNQSPSQNNQTLQNQYLQSTQLSNEANFKKNRASTQTSSTQSGSVATQIPQQGILGIGSGYIASGSNQVIQQQQIQSNSNQNLSQTQGGNKISDEHKSIL